MQKRQHFLDALKVLLTMLVVAHHAGQSYNQGAFWYFKSPETTTVLYPFFSVNAAFFMSLFFLLSAYFVPASFTKKGATRFLRDRLLRIGVPLLAGFLLFIPPLMYAYYLNFRDLPPISFPDYFVHVFLGIGTEKPLGWAGPSWPDMQFGHLWFLEHLLVYALLYTLWRSFVPRRSSFEKSDVPVPGHLAILLFGIVLTLATFLVRTQFPIDEWAGLLGFIQVEYAHVPQYASCFVIGLLAWERGWLTRLPARVGYVWLAVGLVIAAADYGLHDRLFQYMDKGGWTWSAFNKSLEDTFLCLGLCIGFVTLFREKAQNVPKFLLTMSQNTFAVYLIHVPIVVGLQYALGSVELPVVPKFLLVTALGITLSFAVSQWVLRRIPGVRKVLY